MLERSNLWDLPKRPVAWAAIRSRHVQAMPKGTPSKHKIARALMQPSTRSARKAQKLSLSTPDGRRMHLLRPKTKTNPLPWKPKQKVPSTHDAMAQPEMVQQSNTMPVRNIQHRKARELRMPVLPISLRNICGSQTTKKPTSKKAMTPAPGLMLPFPLTEEAPVFRSSSQTAYQRVSGFGTRTRNRFIRLGSASTTSNSSPSGCLITSPRAGT